MGKNHLVFLFFLFILFSLLAVNVLSIGISHPLETGKLEFEPGKEFNYDFGILDTNKQPVEISVGGDEEFSKCITIGELQGKQEDDLRPFNVNIKLPQNFKNPGWHVAYISARIAPSDKGELRIATSISTAIKMFVPFYGKYVDAKISPNNINVNEPLNITFSAESLGTETINTIFADIWVYDAYNNSLGKLRTPSITNLKSRESSQVVSTFISDKFIRGKYFVNGTVDFDGNRSNTVYSRFQVGDYFVNITSVSTDIPFAGIQPFEINVENLWNGNLNDVYAIVEINNQKIKSSSVSLIPFNKNKMTAYVDTSKLKLGENYTVKTTLYYNRDSNTMDSVLHISEQKIVKKAEAPSNINWWAYGFGAFAVVLILLNIYLFFMLKKFVKK